MGCDIIACWLDSAADSGSYTLDHSAQRSLQNAQKDDPTKSESDGSCVCKAVLGVLVAWGLYCSWSECKDNKDAIYQLMTKQTLGEVEHQLTLQPKAELYLPIYRLIFSAYANKLASKQLDKLILSKDKIQIDSCSYRVPNIVLVIGESYNKHHSQLYGYNMPTTPRQVAMAQDGSLVPFTDVVAPWNLTSYVFKDILSFYAVGDKGEWCDYPLFPEVFRKAGYHVTFITNQFQSKAGEAVYDFSGVTTSVEVSSLTTLSLASDCLIQETISCIALTMEC